MSAISSQRLLSRIEQLRVIGQDPQGGITRPFGSAAEIDARQWFVSEAQQAGLSLHVDAAGNIWARYPGKRSGVLAVGSHLDTVPHGGAYDGALGVLMALEAIQSLKESGYAPEHTLAVLVFTGEEPNAFRLSTLGSRLLTGVLSWEDIVSVTDDERRPVMKALEAAGASPDAHDLSLDDVRGFVEPHIEQGPRLQDSGEVLGVVSTITGIIRHAVTLVGEQNHAGTTPWALRHDSVQAFAQVMMIFQQWLARYTGRVTGTVGFVDVYPNAVNIVPSRVEFIVEWRSPDMDLLQQVAQGYWEAVEAWTRSHQITANRHVILNQPPSPMDQSMQTLLAETIAHRGMAAPVMASWAGHDAAHMARRVPTGMLFIRNNGKSHCPDEACEDDDILTAQQVLTDFLVQWDETLAKEGIR
ncbi:Zn-dependent hydrolase [Sulfobacillus sp. hq2]|uniref:Zn-dependent hydrolase n=1 Tax=Sulfobacillus TaxID=28033 RepID=UPI000CD27094|nr:Zn-dependent hydrolase [Sulfobacillus sp. hq2]POB09433.1 Zn-dependent hydrolase [Sulfobacillus sp. hq2]